MNNDRAADDNNSRRSINARNLFLTRDVMESNDPPEEFLPKKVRAANGDGRNPTLTPRTLREARQPQAWRNPPEHHEHYDCTAQYTVPVALRG